MFLLVPAHVDSPRQRAIKQLLFFCGTVTLVGPVHQDAGWL